MEKLTRNVLNMTLAGAFGALTATATLAEPQRIMPEFKTTDGNGDAMVSLQEFQEKGGFEQAFHEGDANRDRRLSSDEYTKATAINDRLKAGKYIDDAVITAKVKALILKDEGVKGLDVNVETHQGMVQLAGWVASPTQIAQAEKIARSVEGVKGVRNALLVKR